MELKIALAELDISTVDRITEELGEIKIDFVGELFKCVLIFDYDSAIEVIDRRLGNVNVTV